MAPHDAEHVRAAPVRQRVVDEDDVRGILAEQRPDVGEARRVADEDEPLRLALERPAQEIGDELVVVDERDADRAGA